jgi:hypothetical protein
LIRETQSWERMKRIPFLAIVLLACAFRAHAQDAKKQSACSDALLPDGPHMVSLSQ